MVRNKLALFFMGLLVIATLFSCNHKNKEKIKKSQPCLFIYDGDENIEDYSFEERGVNIHKGGLVNSPYMAAYIANIVFARIYGEATIQDERPYHVTLINNKYWRVEGGYKLAPHEYGGNALLILRKEDGQILHISHSK